MIAYEFLAPDGKHDKGFHTIIVLAKNLEEAFNYARGMLITWGRRDLTKKVVLINKLGPITEGVVYHDIQRR
jgi:hypothetical protein